MPQLADLENELRVEISLASIIVGSWLSNGIIEKIEIYCFESGENRPYKGRKWEYQKSKIDTPKQRIQPEGTSVCEVPSGSFYFLPYFSRRL